MHVTARQIQDPVFVNQLLHRPLRAKIMAAIALILLVGGIIAAVVANGCYGQEWSSAYTIAPWTIAGASFVALIALRIWFHNIYACTIKDVREEYNENTVNLDINRLDVRHKEKHFTPTQGVSLRNHIETNFPQDSKTILHMLSINSGSDPYHIYVTWVRHRYQITGLVTGTTKVQSFELIEKGGEPFLKFDFASTVKDSDKMIGEVKYTTLTNVRTGIVEIEYEFP